MNSLARPIENAMIDRPGPRPFADAAVLARSLWRSAARAGRLPTLGEIFIAADRSLWHDAFILVDNGRAEQCTFVSCGASLQPILRSPLPNRRLADAVVDPLLPVLDFVGTAIRQSRLVEGSFATTGPGDVRAYSALVLPARTEAAHLFDRHVPQGRYLFCVLREADDRPAMTPSARTGYNELARLPWARKHDRDGPER